MNIAYQVIGDGPFDLLYAPGFISHLEAAWEVPFFAGLFERLASFARLITFDKRGTGLSDRPGGWPTFEERMDDIRAVLDAASSERAALFGISEGGPMCMLFAATYPDRVTSLALYGCAPRFAPAADWPWGAPGEVQSSFMDWVEKHWGEGRVLPTFVDGLVSDQREQEAIGRYERYAASPGAARANLSMNFEIDVRAILPAIRVPTLVIHRMGDPMAPIGAGRYLAEHIPDARLLELPGDFHVSARSREAEEAFGALEEFCTGTRRDYEVDRVLATVLFTDIVGSTERASAMGDRRWRELLDEHDRSVRREIARFQGREIKTTGDGFLSAFDGPARAIRCARAVTSAASRLGLEVRSGLHTGECEVRGDDLAGLAVHIGSRVATLAGPGEVLVSGTVKDLVVGAGIEFEDRGEHELKGVPGPWKLFAVRG
ncbi:MAG TPA: adenylate/guanylate cyclase domain-containing protein [Gemmatimonadales bacterium]|nr:adenylate/guanylate cyclase domain-containing protein [Gemmatimonadales bacterium]